MSCYANENLSKHEDDNRIFAADFSALLLDGEIILTAPTLDITLTGGGTGTLQSSGVALSGSQGASFWLYSGDACKTYIIEATLLTSSGQTVVANMSFGVCE